MEFQCISPSTGLYCGLFFEVRNAGRGRAMHGASDMFTYILLICADSYTQVTSKYTTVVSCLHDCE